MSFLHDRRGTDPEKKYNRKVNLCSELFALQLFHTAIIHQCTVQWFSKQEWHLYVSEQKYTFLP